MKGHIRERSPGHWAIVLENRDPVTGKRKRRWHAFKGTKRQAQVECSRLITELATGLSVDPSRMTVAAYLAHWLAHMASNVSGRTRESYGETIATIAPLIGGRVLGKLRPADIANMYATALQSGRKDGNGGLAPRTVQMMHRVLSQALKQAVKWQMIARNPCDAVSAPRVERKEMRALDAPCAAALIEAARSTPLHMPVLLGLLCGIRRGEAAALRWKDIGAAQLSVSSSLEQTRAGVRRKPPKSGRPRTVALAAMAVDELRRHRIRQAEELLRLGVRQTDDTHVCLQANFEPWVPANLSLNFHRFMKASGLPRVRLHDLRHSHATHLLAANVHPKIVQERLGHANISITIDLYSHVMPGMQEAAADLVDAAMQTALNKHRESKS